jgi:L-malate glycosyltransferase
VETLAASAVRRAAITGESMAVARIADLPSVVPASVSRERLAAIYRSAHAFLCMSEHEGFCIPLLEALHFGVPVVARDAGAIAEVLGGAGVLVSERDSLATVAEAMRIVIGDAELRGVLRERGEERLRAYALERTAERLKAKVETLGAR